MIIGCDVDGVLANFNKAYAQLLTEETDIRFPPVSDIWPDCWDYDKKNGVTKEQQDAVWAIIKASENFWEYLPAYKDTFDFLVGLNDLKWDNDIYFITNRPGKLARFQTECWLEENGFLRPSVIVSDKKGTVCSALKITHYIDDKIDNCFDVRNHGYWFIGHDLKLINTSCYMLARPWNNHEIPGVRRLPKISDFLEILKEDLNA